MNKALLIVIAVSLLVGATLGHYLAVFTSRHQISVPETGETFTLARAIETTIPLFAVEDAVITEAVDLMRVQLVIPGVSTKEHPHPRALNFLIIDPENQGKKIPLTMFFENIRLDLLCKRVARIAEFNVVFDEDAIVFTPQEK